MASAADMDHALRNKLIGLQGWTLVLLLWLSCLLGGVNPQELPKEEMDALQALKRAWNISTFNWNYSRPCGDDLNSTDGERANVWRGVTCDFNNSWSTGVTVTELRLDNMGIVGVLPSDISKLSNLRSMVLSENKFSGEFPFKSIINASELSFIDLSRNQFYGTIQEDAFRNLGRLERLDLSDNEFSGEFPFKSFINGSKLRVISLSSNQFNGTIQEDAFRNLGRLEVLYLSDNKFSGEFPFKSFINASELRLIDLSSNQFNGTIQKDAFWNLGQFQELDLSDNEFSGEFPFSSIHLSDCLYMNISSNQFNGFFDPYDFLTPMQLENLDLSQNNFTILCDSLFRATTRPYKYMNLSSNHFAEFSNNLLPFLNKLPQNLEVLDLSSVHEGVSFAPNFSNISLPSSLSTLFVDKNKFNGTFNISKFFESNTSKSLGVLSLKANMITNVNSLDSNMLNGVSWLPKIRLQGNPYCNETWTTQEDAENCDFYCENTCSEPIIPKKDRSILIMASSIGSAVSVLVIFLVIVGFGFVLRGKQKYIKDLQKKIKEADVNAKRFDYNELRVATKNFASEMKLGEGGYGAVYKGILSSNVVVAVKQLLLNTYASREDFVNEVLLISNLQHQNLVALKGYCLNDRQTLLVYEYVDNCDLDKLLLGRQATMSKSTSQGLQLWKTRLKICQGVAHGLHYLHTFSQFRIIHRDIKASNILVNENFEAKIADFGLARLIAGSVIETSRCAGTFGYLAPEYVSEGQLSEKADIYSFGVLLLEIVSGMRNRDQRIPEGETHLVNWASNLCKIKRLLDMKDPTLIVSEDEVDEVQQVLETALLCLQNDPKKRPAMIQVAAMLALRKANGDALPLIDEELDNFPMDIALEESDCDMSPFFDSSTSARASLGSRPTHNPQIEPLSLSKSGRLWRTCGV